MSETLKPCPFCGGEAALNGDSGCGFYVACTSRDCYAAIGEGYDRDAMPDHSFFDEDLAIAAWERRDESRYRELPEAAKHAAMEWRLHGQLTDSCRVLEAAIERAEESLASDGC